MLSELENQSDSSDNEFSEEECDFPQEDAEKKKKNSKDRIKNNSKSNTKIKNLNNAANNSNEILINNDVKENGLNISKKKLNNKNFTNSFYNKHAKNNKKGLNVHGISEGENEDKNFEKIIKIIKPNESYKNLPSNDLLVTETLFSKKNSAESVFRKFIIEKKLSNQTENFESNLNHSPILNISQNVNPFLEQNNNSSNNAFNHNIKINNEGKKSQHNSEKINSKENGLISSQQPKKTETEGISKLKNKLSLKVKIPGEKSEKKNIDNSNTNNNYFGDFENRANQSSNANNDELTLIKLYPDNYSFKVFILIFFEFEYNIILNLVICTVKIIVKLYN